jgi:uncharacterized membrane protein YfcA
MATMKSDQPRSSGREVVSVIIGVIAIVVGSFAYRWFHSKPVDLNWLMELLLFAGIGAMTGFVLFRLVRRNS